MIISVVFVPSSASIVKGENGKSAVRKGVLVHREASSYMPELRLSEMLVDASASTRKVVDFSDPSRKFPDAAIQFPVRPK